MQGTGSTMEASTCHASTEFDTILSVYAGRCFELVCVASNDDASCEASFGLSTVQWEALQGVTYFVLVHGYQGASGLFSLSLVEL